MINAAKRTFLPAYFALCLVLGGASNGGFVENSVLQLLAAAILLGLGIFGARARTEIDPPFKWLFALISVVLIFQFVPIPMSVWTAFPGRSDIGADLAMLGVVPKPPLVTLSIHETIASFVWSLPPIALAFALAFRPRLDVSTFAAVLVAFAFLSIAIGLIQFFGDRNSAAYFYEITNRGLMVGFFANANHMATLLLVTLPFLSALARSAIEKRPQQKRELVTLWIILTGFVIIGILLVGSLTGFGLAIPVIIVSCAVMLPSIRKFARWALIPALLLGGTIVALSDEVGNVFAEDSAGSQRGRDQIFATTFEAARHYWPAGTGLGTFREIYDNFEDVDAADTTYVNHAHNDYLEILLEFGAAGVLAIVAFLAWWARSLIKLSRMELRDPFVPAAGISSGVILLHSFWDYPLRTVAIGCVFAMCCVVLARAITQNLEGKTVPKLD